MKYLLFDGSEDLGFDLIWTFDQFNCWSPFIHLTQIAKLEKDISADRSYQLTRRLWDLWKYISKYEFRLSTFGFWTFRGRSMCIFSWCLLVIIKASYMWACSFFWPNLNFGTQFEGGYKEMGSSVKVRPSVCKVRYIQ